MKAVTDNERFRQPTIKRLGLDDGWWFFCPHFLNLGLPFVFVDACLLPETEYLDLEPFGERKPDTPLPFINLHIGILGDSVGLHSASPPIRLITEHCFRTLTIPRALQCERIGILVGDSFALQLTWSALWTCQIGTATALASSAPWG